MARMLEIDPMPLLIKGLIVCAAFTAATPATIAATPPKPVPLPKPIGRLPASLSFDRFFQTFRQAVLDDDRQKVADMTTLPFRDFSGAEPERSAQNRAEFLSRYDRIFAPAVIAGIRANRLRAFKPGSDDGEAPGPIGKGEYLLDLEDWSSQIVFSPSRNGYRMSRIPFYS